MLAHGYFVKIQLAVAATPQNHFDWIYVGHYQYCKVYKDAQNVSLINTQQIAHSRPDICSDA
ncbi:hypothetical protein Vi05172_g599 [Venturia inaequalis]|nr:hypothetical protein Vi05172_g599 [Venturia inaequalis]